MARRTSYGELSRKSTGVAWQEQVHRGGVACVQELRDELKRWGVPAERVDACLEKSEQEGLLQ